MSLYLVARSMHVFAMFLTVVLIMAAFALSRVSSAVYTHPLSLYVDTGGSALGHRSHPAEFRVRRFFCLMPGCCRTIFTERFPTIVAPWARRTRRLAERQRTVGLALGGAAGARVSAQLNQPTSRDTLLRLVQQTPEQDAASPPPTPRTRQARPSATRRLWARLRPGGGAGRLRRAPVPRSPSASLWAGADPPGRRTPRP